jgi:hypothetical protein
MLIQKKLIFNLIQLLNKFILFINFHYVVEFGYLYYMLPITRRFKKEVLSFLQSYLSHVDTTTLVGKIN